MRKNKIKQRILWKSIYCMLLFGHSKCLFECKVKHGILNAWPAGLDHKMHTVILLCMQTHTETEI